MKAEFNKTNLHLLILTAFEFLGHFHSKCRKGDKPIEPLIEAQVQIELYEFILEWFTHHQWQEGESTPLPEITATTMSWAIFGVGIQWSRGDRKFTAEQVADQVVTFLSGGIGCPPG